ncbi:DUF2063 domain-containing protein [Thalassospira sp. MCCC 1A01428]|uniref:HvfC/BufC N-terminal domain-containing protein n=1 Tax=Thalassospira sp. MCCC 1A01428 TaxID=1470575 RepID=UPI000A1E4B2E|nr:DNA-binding domain-containing protein [Thalassospira sp. MCCC 1A01428]
MIARIQNRQEDDTGEASDAGFHQAFATALMDEDPAAFPAGLDERAARRFAIYRNNVHRGLQEALAAAYPVVKTLVGERFFYAVAADYMRSEPQRSPSLALYGRGFAAFLADNDAVARVPYIPDIARAERAWLEALHEADAPAMMVTDLAGQEDRLISLCFRVHPATRMVSSNFPIVSLWRANQADRKQARQVPIPDRAETALITRPHFQVQMTLLDGGAGNFASQLLAGASVGEAFEYALAQDADFDVTPVFARLLASGMFCGFTLGDQGF